MRGNCHLLSPAAPVGPELSMSFMEEMMICASFWSLISFSIIELLKASLTPATFLPPSRPSRFTVVQNQQVSQSITAVPWDFIHYG